MPENGKQREIPNVSMLLIIGCRNATKLLPEHFPINLIRMIGMSIRMSMAMTIWIETVIGFTPRTMEMSGGLLPALPPDI
jgi:hypothetical protein